jgi:hypothetical protein
MAGIGLLNRIHGKGTDGIDTQVIDIFPGFSQTFSHDSFLLFSVNSELRTINAD